MRVFRCLLFVCCLLLPSASALEKRQFLLPRFLYLRLSNTELADEKHLQQRQRGRERSHNVVEAAIVEAAVAPMRQEVRRQCYFSPVQCLLRTEGQHRAFENHPEFNSFGETPVELLRQRLRKIAKALGKGSARNGRQIRGQVPTLTTKRVFGDSLGWWQL